MSPQKSSQGIRSQLQAHSCFVSILKGRLFVIQAWQAVTTPAGVRKPPETNRKSVQ
ncbi:MAG: hypothetical protein JNM43_21885 [Planctomycetaceae bacterium]|nr:hypothetical protein [Planctomycetaceae bacterium]